MPEASSSTAATVRQSNSYDRRSSLLAQARASKRRLLACNLSEHYVEIFEITRLSDFISVLPDEESAIAEASVS